jgi:hypothetical protein
VLLPPRIEDIKRTIANKRLKFAADGKFESEANSFISIVCRRNRPSVKFQNFCPRLRLPPKIRVDPDRLVSLALYPGQKWGCMFFLVGKAAGIKQ